MVKEQKQGVVIRATKKIMDSISENQTKKDVTYNQLKKSDIPRESRPRGVGINNISVDKPLFMQEKHNEYVMAYINIIESAFVQADIRFSKNGQPINDEFSDWLVNTPTSSGTWVDFASAMVSNYLLYGNAYALIIRDGLGRKKLKRLVVIHPTLISVDRNTDTDEVVYKISGQTGVVNSHNIIHIRGMTEDGLEGYNYTKNARNTKNLSKQMDESLYEKMGKNNVPFYIDSSGFTLDPEDPTTKAYMAFYQSMRTNYQSGKSILVNNSEFSELKPLKDEPHYFNVEAVSKMIERRVVSMLNIPFSYLSESGEGDGYKAILTQTIPPILTRFESELTRKLLTSKERVQGYRIDFDRLSLQKADLTKLAPVVQAFIRNMVATPDEMRKIVGLGPKGGVASELHISRDLLDDDDMERTKKGQTSENNDV